MSLRRCSRPSRPRTDPSPRIPPGGRGELERHGLDHEIDWHLSGKPFITGRGKLVAALSGAIMGCVFGGFLTVALAIFLAVPLGVALGIWASRLSQ